MSRTNFKFKIALRIFHPSINPDQITQKLSLRPSHTYMAGSARNTPKGNPLPGTNKNSMWFFEIGEKSEGESGTLSDMIREMNEKLWPARDFFCGLQDSGGKIEYFIGWFSGLNSGETLDWALLQKCSDLRIDLSLDVYGGVKPGSG